MVFRLNGMIHICIWLLLLLLLFVVKFIFILYYRFLYSYRENNLIQETIMTIPLWAPNSKRILY